ncbi:MAG: hypothetical protein BroJett014_05590 [Planctomycetota bacterium]|nr:hypothetical protein [Planctomycetota bacterium]GIK51586.1 MAG: hypothetical protein BroJett014_05590 [Planctomycetota bacterium]
MTRTLCALVFLLAMAGLAALGQIQADAGPPRPRPPRPAPVPEPAPAPEAPKDERARADRIDLVTDDMAALKAERTGEGNFVLALSFTVPASNYVAELDRISRDEATRNIRAYATIKTSGDMGAQVLTQRTVKPEFSNFKTGKYVVELWVRKAGGEYEPRATWVVNARAKE